jgi:hypothetical protein
VKNFQKLLQTVNLKSEGVTGLCIHQSLIFVSCKEGKLASLRLEEGQLEVVNYGQPRLGMLAGLEKTYLGLLLYSFHKYVIFKFELHNLIFFSFSENTSRCGPGTNRDHFLGCFVLEVATDLGVSILPRIATFCLLTSGIKKCISSRDVSVRSLLRLSG